MPCQHVAGHRGLKAHKGHHWWHWRSTTHRGYLAQLHNHHLVTSLLAICRSPCHKGSRPRQMAPMSGELHDQNNFQHSLQVTTSTANRQAPRTPRRAPKHIELAPPKMGQAKGLAHWEWHSTSLSKAEAQSCTCQATNKSAGVCLQLHGGPDSNSITQFSMQPASVASHALLL